MYATLLYIYIIRTLRFLINFNASTKRSSYNAFPSFFIALLVPCTSIAAQEASIYEAIYYGNINNVIKAHKSGASVRGSSQAGEGLPPLSYTFLRCRGSNCEKIANYLIDSGADVNEKAAYKGNTALVYAASSDTQFNPSNIINALVKRGALVDVTNSDGLTPLWFAIEDGKLEHVKALLSAGASVEVRFRNPQQNLLHAIASEAGSIEKSVSDLNDYAEKAKVIIKLTGNRFIGERDSRQRTPHELLLYKAKFYDMKPAYIEKLERILLPVLSGK